MEIHGDERVKKVKSYGFYMIHGFFINPRVKKMQVLVFIYIKVFTTSREIYNN